MYGICIPDAITTSPLVAPVLGIAPRGPITKITSKVTINPNLLPATFVNSLTLPLFLDIAITAHDARPTPVNKKPILATSQQLPNVFPRYGGKIKFPAPKNRENSAKPIIITVSYTHLTLPTT